MTLRGTFKKKLAPAALAFSIAAGTCLQAGCSTQRMSREAFRGGRDAAIRDVGNQLLEAVRLKEKPKKTWFSNASDWLIDRAYDGMDIYDDYIVDRK